jgi:hypothetical protein
MVLVSVRLVADDHLRDPQQVKRSLDYIRVHSTDAPPTYVDALIVVNQVDRAASALIAELLDKGQRQEALLSVQGFASVPGTPRDTTLEARRRALIARGDVQAAIDKVGRIERYRVEAP